MLANRASTGANFRKVFARRFILYQNVNKRRIQHPYMYFYRSG